MLKDVTYLTFFNIQHSQRFFNVINNCVEPVTLRLPTGETKDLRFNFIVQNFLTWIDPYGDIPEVQLQCTNSQDVEHLIQFMMENCRAKTD
ncbi:hypothetical protein VT91_03910 [Clostridium sporogenes]|nr:hypothetical protein [Clostridium botulinum]KRU26774.1 hypothetical protein VT28_29990 [Clostridium sporogenes]KRU29638.1 hypothetical protein WG71_14830 [Clostridium sporogenes]KRU35403.1 hypothetical protein VT91_03910 [Clostridium sporogenes]KRU49628.1 hypothetical protein VT95_02950 [Clostridium sporogenes]MBZ1328476.1 hypothetical protein [Clostridium botulinum]